jgi:hypothetical protein
MFHLRFGSENLRPFAGAQRICGHLRWDFCSGFKGPRMGTNGHEFPGLWPLFPFVLIRSIRG